MEKQPSGQDWKIMRAHEDRSKHLVYRKNYRLPF